MTKTEVSGLVRDNWHLILIVAMAIGFAVKLAHAEDQIARNTEFRQAFGPEVRQELRVIREAQIRMLKDVEALTKELLPDR